MQVETVSLDELIADQVIPVPNYLKIDVEGSEWLVLIGAKNMLTNNNPVIFLATHEPVGHRKCCDFLRALNYEIKPIGGKFVETAATIIASKKALQA